jgi:hypothetical protein
VLKNFLGGDLICHGVASVCLNAGQDHLQELPLVFWVNIIQGERNPYLALFFCNKLSPVWEIGHPEPDGHAQQDG